MALDLYVMPLWRFKTGDIVSPVESVLNMKVKIVTPDGIQKRPERVGWFTKWRAKQKVHSIRKAVEKTNGKRISWDDEGSTEFNEQGHYFEALRAYAKWLDYRDQYPVFEQAPNGDYYQHKIWELEYDHLTCQQLVEHDCYSGYFLPCEFETLIHVEPFQMAGMSFSRPVGSTPQLLRELDIVHSVLRVANDYDWQDDDELKFVKIAYLRLREAAEISNRVGLPLIFWG